ncbi:MAG TPA: signal peptidase II [Terriglobales bacterium]|nr:signal peptidase II [Terriglobales bacterium]
MSLRIPIQFRHLAIGVGVFVADQVSKGMIDKLPDDFSYTVIPGVFRIIHAENPGVAFGLFQYSAPGFRDILIGASSLALLAVLALLWKSKQTTRAGVAMALIVGGACGNLFDRILHGKVVDFLLFYSGSHSWPVFNLADSAIVVGAALLVWEIVEDRPAPAAAATSVPQPPNPVS